MNLIIERYTLLNQEELENIVEGININTLLIIFMFSCICGVATMERCISKRENIQHIPIAEPVKDLQEVKIN